LILTNKNPQKKPSLEMVLAVGYCKQQIEWSIDYKQTDLNCWIILSASQQQKVIITNKHGNKLVGILHEAGTKEIVILCHGLRASKVSFPDSWIMNSLFIFVIIIIIMQIQYLSLLNYVFQSPGRHYHDTTCGCSRECRNQFFPLWLHRKWVNFL
jgi:hypothetical protein